MINTLDEYIGRSMPDAGSFATNPNLMKKVDAKGKLLPFRGNTVVYLLDETVKKQLAQLRDQLYLAAPEMLADKLREDTFHMTLHDLVNGAPGEENLARKMEQAKKMTWEILSQWEEVKTISMRATWIFNMVNTSIVLGLKPVDEDNWQQLDQMYCALESVVNLGYGLTPHITLAYFRPGMYNEEQVRKLKEALKPVEMDVVLRRENLVLQNFTDMNSYQTIRQ